MRSALVRALRGICSAISLLAFAVLFLAAESRVTDPTVLLGLAGVGTATLSAAVGPAGVRRLLGVGESSANDSEDGDGAVRDERAEPGDAWLDETADDTPWTDRADRAAAESDPDWWVARLEPALDDAWNRWSDLALTVGLALLGVGSFALLATYPGDDPPLGLALVGLFGLNGALLTVPFLFE
ncbi:hypothetical protein [Halorubrum tebenquichense]|uniref:Uncharacterized protein n=1 Tax=Halorubrum tebenquichense DSM 14210 TaxID=1227485 RepID=M0DLT4_9EURY|nr:hypothetical protein [Halorubrum tebenquichense]ELZ35672.1 hypothetical protein C472_11614 [Halorubrum tebenquichense DSM 14210]